MSLLNSRPGCSCLDSTAMGNIHHGRFFLERCLGHSGATFFPLPSSCGLMRWCLFPWTQLVWTMKWKLLFMIGSQICWWNRISSCFKSVHLVSEAFPVLWNERGFQTALDHTKKVSVKEVNSCQQQFSFTRCQQSCSLLRCICGSLYLEL